MKVIIGSSSDGMGGAGIAAKRLHQALCANGVDSKMVVDFKESETHGVQAIGNKHINRLKFAEKFICRAISTTINPVLHSLNIIPGHFPGWLYTKNFDLVHLHWINNGFISIRDMNRIKTPLVWTMHDMWAMCGAEHYPIDDRWKSGYSAPRPANETGIDINRAIWKWKKFNFKRKINLICPSRWMQSVANESPLTNSWPTKVIPNAIDTDIWKPIPKSIGKSILGIDDSTYTVGFGAVGGGNDPRKGSALLLETLTKLKNRCPNVQAIVFGQSEPEQVVETPVPVKYVGKLHDDISLRLIYSAMDLFVIPSRLDNLPNTGLEALACGRPVFGFHAGGLEDIVSDDVGGLAPKWDTDFLSEMIGNLLQSSGMDRIGDAARNKALSKFSSPVIAKLHHDYYQEIISSANERR